MLFLFLYGCNKEGPRFIIEEVWKHLTLLEKLALGFVEGASVVHDNIGVDWQDADDEE